ncbi:MAG: ADP-glyceromanno-heptose 6-epimerase [Bacteroidetes bacterium]|nr:ADP-glyceromanno-heptose 6-epimerase [Bacteroidota bacterium]
MIIVTGALGFIGSCLIQKLNDMGYTDIVAVDDFSKTYKNKNLLEKRISKRVERSEYLLWQRENQVATQMVFHLGARTDTTEFNWNIFEELNLNYSKEVWNICTEFGLPLVYASSAATYGNGEQGYDDDVQKMPLLKPLNPYGDSKQLFDLWVLKQEKKPFFWAGLKFFNVYGPNEYHKGRMASVVFHAFNQIQEKKQLNLFRSHRPDFNDGEQLRDFVYVKDVVNVLLFLMENREQSGIYNLGTGQARSFNDLAKAVFGALNFEPAIHYIDTPIDIRETYQYFTQAKMQKLKEVGYSMEFNSLEEGVADYVKNYLIENKCY